MATTNVIQTQAQVQRKIRVYGEVWSLGSCGGAWSLDLLHMCKFVKEKFGGVCERIQFIKPRYDGPECIAYGYVKVRIDVVVPEDKLGELLDEIAWGLGHYWHYPKIVIDKENKKIIFEWRTKREILYFEEVQ